MSLIKLSSFLFFFCLALTSYSQCVNSVEMLNEQFDAGPINGAVTANIYGTGSYGGGGFGMNGTNFGWFNVRNGFSDVDLYDRQIDGFCIDSAATVTFWTRESFGSTDVSYSIIDDNGVVLATTNMILTTTYQFVTLNFTVSTYGLRFVIHCNNTGGSGKDVIVEDLIISQCCSCSADAGPDIILCPDVLNFSVGADPVSMTGTNYSWDNLGTNGTIDLNVGNFDNGQSTINNPGVNTTYTVSVDFGGWCNETDAMELIIDEPPTASNPIDLNFECNADVPLPNVDDVFDELDDISVPMVIFISDATNGLSCPEIITRTYSVTDECNNETLVNQTITVNDITPPTATNPPTIILNPGDLIPPVNILDVNDEIDNCTITPVVQHISDVSDGIACPETITRTYSVTDDCNNQTIVEQLIVIPGENINPSGSAPDDFLIECIGDLPLADPNLIIDEADNNGIPIVTFIEDVSSNTSCPEIITRTYRITDLCNNFIDIEQLITIQDVTPPTAGPLPNINIECLTDIPANDITVITDETDNCSTPTVAFIGDVSDNNTCPETITRTYRITDDCGNIFDVDQVIIVNDMTAPIASNQFTSVSCSNDVPDVNINIIDDVTDNCTMNPLVEFISESSDGNFCNGEIITRIYSITDECGNTNNVTHTITIEATMALIDAGLDINVCNDDPLTLNANCNIPNAVISWDQNVIDNIPFTPISGLYTVTADVCSGQCVATDDLNIVINPSPNISFSADVVNGCEPLLVTFNSSTTEVGNSCIWDFGNGVSTTGCNQIETTFTSGIFNITLTVTSSDGCVSTETYTDYISVSELPIASYSYLPNPIDIENTEVNFTNLSTGGTSFEWDFGDQTSISNVENPIHIFPEITGDYLTTLWVFGDNLECKDSATILIHIDDVLIYYIPNTFTPDGDLFNESFHPIFTSGFDVNNYHLIIFNRWGEILFESYDSSIGWDGTYANGTLVNGGVYIWQVEFGNINSDERHLDRGHITVLK